MRHALYILAFIIAAQVSVWAQEPPSKTETEAEEASGFFIGLWIPNQKFPFDTYGEIPEWDEHVRLDRFAMELLQKPDLIGYVIARSRPGEDSETSAARLEQSKTYLTYAYTIEEDRIITITKCGNGETKFELWIETPGKFLPNSPPTVTLEARVKDK